MTAAARAAAAVGASVPSAGTGLGGRVTLGDMAAAPASVTVPTATITGEGAITETPIKGIRKLISDRMSQSLAETAQLTLNADAKAAAIEAYRARLKASDESLGLNKISINDLVLYAVARTLPRFPFMNAHKVGDTLKTFERVHLGMAVDTPRGLMVPVIRNANLLSLAQISAEAKRLAAACQSGSITPDELSGSTFTVTNLGGLGINSFTPVLNFPEVGILGVCNIELKPVAKDGDVKFESRIGFSLTINHQVIDGAPGAKFLKGLADTVANIDLWLAL
jgi:pyruvate dehydrogenase E2 component (dihydrolipoamide acetyltransferase)